MKIVHVTYFVNAQYRDPAVWLDKLSFFTGVLAAMRVYGDIHYVSFIDYEGTVERQGVCYHFFRGHALAAFFPFRIHRFIRSLNPDAVIVHGILYPWQVLLLRAHLGKRVKICVQHHAEAPLTGVRGWLQGMADQFVRGYFFTSVHQANPWVEKRHIVNADKIHSVMEVSSLFNPMPRHLALRQTNVTGDRYNFIWVGRLDANKNPLLVVRAFLAFVKMGFRAALYMIYQVDTLLPAVKEVMLANHPWSDMIHLVGKVSHTQLCYWYNSVDFILSGSYYEGSGVAVCEAMSCGCIPVVTDIPSFRMMTDNGAAGILYKVGDDVQLLAALCQATQLDKSEMRHKVLTVFKSRLSSEAIASDIYDVLS